MNKKNLKLTGVDMINMFCGERLGYGAFREVYVHNFDPTLVIKIEHMRSYKNERTVCNFQEFENWKSFQYCDKISKWLAPCVSLSPDGRILLQKRAEPARVSELPDKVPKFLTDLKTSNFGFIDGKLVAVDYSTIIVNPNTKKKNAGWNDH